MNFLRRLLARKITIKDNYMQHFSQEYLDKLIAEHKLVSASIGRLQGVDYSRQTRSHGVMRVDNTLAAMATRKIELEAYIDTLNEHLNG